MADNDIPQQQAVTNPPQSTVPQPEMVNVTDPDTGEIGSIPKEQLQQAMDLGYSQANPEDVQKQLDIEQYGTPEQKAKAFLEGAARGTTLGLSSAAERIAGVPAEDILKRQEVNRGWATAGEVAGLGASALLGTGEASLLEKAGSAGAAALGLGKYVTNPLTKELVYKAGESAAEKIGSEAVRNSIAGMILQGGDEVSKMILQDPKQSAQTALVDLGLSSIIGGASGAAFGSISPLWEATAKSRLGTTLHAIQQKLGGTESIVPQEIDKAIAASGIDIPPAIRSALSKNPDLEQMFRSLMESATGAGKSTQEALAEFKTQAADVLVKTLGRTPSDVDSLSEMSEHEIGSRLQKLITKRLKENFDPLTQQFEEVKNKFSKVSLDDDVKSKMADAITKMAQEKGYNVSPSSPQASQINTVLKELPGLSTLEDLRKYGSIIGENTDRDPKMWNLGSELKKIFRAAEDSEYDRQLTNQAQTVTHAPSRYSIFTAANPGGKTLSMEENAARMNDLYQLLDKYKMPYQKVTGNYGGNPEPGVLVPHINSGTETLLNDIAKSFGQESIVHKLGKHNKLLYLTGDNTGKFVHGNGITFNNALSENFTEWNGKKFQLGLNFDKPMASEHLIHYSANPNVIDEIKPEFQGTGAAGREQLRGPEQIPKSYYYEENTPPEDVVLTRARNVYTIKRPFNILDLNTEEAGRFYRQAEAETNNPTDFTNKLEQLIKDAGYSGYKNTGSGQPNAVAVFEARKPISHKEFEFNHVKDLNERLKERGFEHGKAQLEQTALGLGEGEGEGEGEEGTINKLAAARAAYRANMGLVDDINDRLHAGHYSGPGSFIAAVRQMAPEDVLNRLSPKGDASLLPLLDQFPEVKQEIQNYHLNKILRNAAEKAGPDQIINPKHVFDAFAPNRMAPEMRNFLASPEAQTQMQAIQQVLEGVPWTPNSRTAKNLDSMWAHIPASAGAIAGLLEGHDPVGGALLGHMAKTLGRDIPDAARLSLLKFLGSDSYPSSAGFKSMFDYLHSVIQGETMINRAVKSLFQGSQAGAIIKQPVIAVSDSDRRKLDKRLMAMQENPEQLTKVGGDTSYYMPEHNSALAESTVAAVNYLNGQRPQLSKLSPLDSDFAENNSVERAAFEKTLAVAEQPLSVINSIKQGTITEQEVNTIKILYPDLYKKLAVKMMGEIAGKMNGKNKSIPYNMRMSLSMFLGQPLDSSMVPESIINAQPAPKQQPPMMANKPGTKKSGQAVAKMAEGAKTQNQARETRTQIQK